MSDSNYLFLFGTRPEAIKLAPLILEAKKRNLKMSICFTGQHKEMATSVLDFFGIKPDIFLDIMKPNQSLNEISSGVILGLQDVLGPAAPTHIIVQGDTTSAAIGALFGFYEKIKVVHIEAGLRTYNLDSPWPEEFNRRLISLAAEINFVPTEAAAQNLKSEGVAAKRIFNVGNTGIDALRIASEKIVKDKENTPRNKSEFKILVTLHRRESFGSEMIAMMEALKALLDQHPNLKMIWPLHENPNIKATFEQVFKLVPSRLKIVKPLGYKEFIEAMIDCDLIITDSGGIQEEAPFLGKPTLVCRQNTERPEAIASGNSILVGTDPQKIIDTVALLISNEASYKSMSFKNNLYGDGFSSEKILDLLKESAAKS